MFVYLLWTEQIVLDLIALCNHIDPISPRHKPTGEWRESMEVSIEESVAVRRPRTYAAALERARTARGV